jgi:hypothetical protein
MRRGTWAAVITCVIGLGVGGCWNPFSPDGGNGNGHPIGDRTSPDNLLEYFATAYEDKSLERYDEALDEFYSFTFMKDDWTAAGVSEDRPYWGKSEDEEQTEILFTHAETKAISFDLVKVMTWYYCVDTVEVGGQPQEVDAWCCTIKPDIRVDVEKDGKSTTFWVKNSWLDVKVVEDRLYPGLWTVLRIEEFTAPE